ncbi:hypothetical protein PIB30_096439, partial [Stylosanthes scabra]|nr:hypothetical protein [Stylosanthes scabra]
TIRPEKLGTDPVPLNRPNRQLPSEPVIPVPVFGETLAPQPFTAVAADKRRRQNHAGKQDQPTAASSRPVQKSERRNQRTHPPQHHVLHSPPLRSSASHVRRTPPPQL